MMMGGEHSRSGDAIDENQSSAPRTLERMLGSKAPSYSPLTVSRQKNGTTDGGDATQGRNTLSVSMSDDSSSAFNAHSPPYMRGRADQHQSRGTTENLDMEDIYEPVGRKSEQNFSAKDYSAA